MRNIIFQLKKGRFWTLYNNLLIIVSAATINQVPHCFVTLLFHSKYSKSYNTTFVFLNRNQFGVGIISFNSIMNYKKLIEIIDTFF